MTEAEILDRVDRIRRAGMGLGWVLDQLADLSRDLATLPYLEANDRRPRHPGQGTPRTPDRSTIDAD